MAARCTELRMSSWFPMGKSNAMVRYYESHDLREPFSIGVKRFFGSPISIIVASRFVTSGRMAMLATPQIGAFPFSFSCDGRHMR
jgi:hypothetical protein